MNPLSIHSQPEGLRRPVLITAFSGWNDAAESATTAARYLATAFGGEKFAEQRSWDSSCTQVSPPASYCHTSF